MKKYILLIVLTILVNNSLFAAEGCLRNGQVYTTPPSGLNRWTGPVQGNCPVGATTSSVFAYVNSTTSTTCSIGFLGLSGSGVIVDYSIVNCPLDNYIPLLMLCVSGAAVFFLRNRLV